MKASVEHRVPLSDRCIEILKGLPEIGDYVFPGNRTDEHVVAGHAVPYGSG